MPDTYYPVPENPTYDLSQIRRIQNSDPVNADQIVNPVIGKLIENITAIGSKVIDPSGESAVITRETLDKELELVSEETVQKMVDGDYVPGSDPDEDDIADDSDITPIIDNLFNLPEPEIADDGDDETASGEDIQNITDGLYPN